MTCFVVFFLSLFDKLCFVVHHFFLCHFLGRPLSYKLKVDPLSSLSSVGHGGAVNPSLAIAENLVFHHLFLPSLPYMHLPTFSCLTSPMITIRNIINLQI